MLADLEIFGKVACSCLKAQANGVTASLTIHNGCNSQLCLESWPPEGYKL